MRPGFDWYFFVDADTYVLWAALAEWLKTIDAQEKLYMGSVTMLSGMPFAHGGSGYLVSKGLMEAMFESRTGVANNYEIAASRTCCGDALFARAVLNETGVSVINVAPIVNGEKPGTLEFGPKQWCQPLVTMHHMGSQEISEFDALESARGYSSPMRLKDVFEAFVRYWTASLLPGWDNQSNQFQNDQIHFVDRTLSEERYGWADSRKIRNPERLPEFQQIAHKSPSACQTACERLIDCLQWRFTGGVCSLGTTVRMGVPRNTDPQDRLTSGWELERIEAWARANEDCGDVVWPKR